MSWLYLIILVFIWHHPVVTDAFAFYIEIDGLAEFNLFISLLLRMFCYGKNLLRLLLV